MRNGIPIFINGRFVTQRVTGVQRYAREVVRELDLMLQAGTLHDPMTLLMPPGGKDVPTLQRIALRTVGRLSGHAWEQFELPFHARQGVLVNLSNTAPLVKRRQLVTFHDAAVYAVPYAYQPRFRAWYRLIFNVCGRRAAKVITVSQFSKKELTRFVHLNEHRIEVVSEGCDHITRSKANDTILDAHGLRGKRYILAVGNRSPHKNFNCVASAMGLIPNSEFEFVVVGGTNPNVFSAADANVTLRVRYVGYVDDAQLRALYEHAVCFVFPSLYEGFGLPPIEAMACGCPVIAADAASMPEVCGDAALYFDPTSPEDLANKIGLMMANESLRRQLRQRGHARAEQLTWRRSADNNLRQIRTLMSTSAV